MTEGMMELTKDIGIGTAICGMMGWMMSVGARYRQRPARGLAVGLMYGLLMLLPFAALLPLLLLAETPSWAADVWLASTVLYQGSLGVMFARHRANGALVVAAKTPAKESLKAGYATSGLLMKEVAKSLDQVPSPAGAIRSGWLARSPF